MEMSDRGVPPEELADEDLVREVDRLHATRGEVLRGGTESALHNHTARQGALEQEFLRRFPAAAAPDPARTRAGRRRDTPAPVRGSTVAAAVIDCDESATRFWTSTLCTRKVHRWTDAHGTEFVQLDDLDGVAIPVLLQPVQDQGNPQPSTHVDLVPLPGNSQAAEVNRLVELGATVINDASDLPWVVLADPAGNRFCMLPPHSPAISGG